MFLLEIYRNLLISAAHLHLIILDAYESTRFCPAENRPQHHQTIRKYVTGNQHFFFIFFSSDNVIVMSIVTKA